MATRQQLHAARNASLKLARVAQQYSQSNILMANEATAVARAELQALAATAAATATTISTDNNTSAVVSQGAASIVTDNSGGPSVAATLTVTDGVLVRATMSVATDCITQHGNTAPVRNSQGTLIANGTANVAAGAVVSYNMGTTVAGVVNGVKQSGWTVTGSGTFFTPTVVNGVCTGGVLSAS